MQIITGTFQKNRLSSLGKQQLGADLHLPNIQLGIQIRSDYTFKKRTSDTKCLIPPTLINWDWLRYSLCANTNLHFSHSDGC